MDNCNPSGTPADTSVNLTKPKKIENEGSPNVIEVEVEDNNLKIPYRQAVGSLMYLMLCTRPDLSQSVIKVSQFSTNFNNTHWTAVKCILRYVKGTKDIVLTLGSRLSGGSMHSEQSDPITLFGSCDSDWAGDLDDRRSTTGYLFFINNGPVSWSTRKQTSVVTSSTQAEYQALSSAVKEAIWLRTFLKELGFSQLSPTIIHQDNQSTIALAKNPIHHGKSKHIDIVHHFIRECIEREEIELEYRPTADMIADALTKPLARGKFEKCVTEMGLKRQY